MQPRTEDTALAPIGVKMVLGCVVAVVAVLVILVMKKNSEKVQLQN